MRFRLSLRVRRPRPARTALSRRTARAWVLVALLPSAAAQGPPQEPAPQEPVVPDRPPGDPRDPFANEAALELRVNRAMARGVEALRRAQTGRGSWTGYEADHPGGMTALVVYTLLQSGVRPDDPMVTRALDELRDQEFSSVYSSAVFLMLLESLHPTEERERLAVRELARLVDWQVRGLWGERGYPGAANDLSNTLFAVLGLRAAHRTGLAVPRATIDDCADALWKFQSRDGGFSYVPDRPPSAGMTAATLGCLVALEEMAPRGSRVPSILRKRKKDRAEAEAWYAERGAVAHNAVGERWTTMWHFPHLWALERWHGWKDGRVVPDAVWYRSGAGWLLERQNPDGTWGRDGGRVTEDTCFALLFLRRASVTPDTTLDALYEELDAAWKEEPNPWHLRPAPSLPYLRDWLLAGPFQGKPGDDLVGDPPFDVTKAKLAPGKKFHRRTWERVALRDGGWTDLEALTGRSGDHVFWLLATVVEVPESLRLRPRDHKISGGRGRGALWLTLEDGAVVWRDGFRCFESRRIGSAIEEDQYAEILLDPGRHVILVLVEDAGGASAFAARLSDHEGKPLPDDIWVGADF